MPSLARRIFAEWLGTAFLLAAVVGSGIMAQKLAGGNIALALLCNTIPTGAMLVVLILIFGPISGAHFNPAVSIAFALRGELTSCRAALYIVVQIIGAIAGVWAVHLMFELPVWQFSRHRAYRRRTMVRRSSGDVRIVADDLWMPCPPAAGRTLCGRPLHHVGLLVHGVHVVRQSGRDHCTLVFRHVRGNSARWRAGIHRGAAMRNGRGCSCR